MVLFLSDIHFGRHDLATERALEADLIACLESQAGQVERLYLLGDVFDQYIEYRHLVPKGFVRFQALLATWTDRGVPVTYLVGNHDPWHRDYFHLELGVEVRHDPFVEPLYGTDVYMHHGDGLHPGKRHYRRLKPWLRHPLPVWLYRTLLPGDAGYGLARWVKQRLADEQPEPALAVALQAFAYRMLAAGRAGGVVMGHSHLSTLQHWPEGWYLNTGFWREERTLGCLTPEGPRLLAWNGNCTIQVHTTEAAGGLTLSDSALQYIAQATNSFAQHPQEDLSTPAAHRPSKGKG